MNLFTYLFGHCETFSTFVTLDQLNETTKDMKTTLNTPSETEVNVSVAYHYNRVYVTINYLNDSGSPLPGTQWPLSSLMGVEFYKNVISTSESIFNTDKKSGKISQDYKFV